MTERSEPATEARAAPKPEGPKPETPTRKGSGAQKEVHERLHTERVTVKDKCVVIYSRTDTKDAYKGNTVYIQVSDTTSKAALETVKELLEVVK